MRGVTGRPQHPRRPAFISTHTPHARRDFDFVNSAKYNYTFLLTRLMRGVTKSRCDC